MKKLWFKDKTYGFGWYPVTIEGWIAVLVYLVLMIVGAVVFSILITNITKFILLYLLYTGLLTILLIILCFKTGEKPEWRWGKKKDV